MVPHAVFVYMALAAISSNMSRPLQLAWPMLRCGCHSCRGIAKNALNRAQYTHEASNRKLCLYANHSSSKLVQAFGPLQPFHIDNARIKSDTSSVSARYCVPIATNDASTVLEYCKLGQPVDALPLLPSSIISRRPTTAAEFDPYSPMPLHYCQVTTNDPYDVACHIHS